MQSSRYIAVMSPASSGSLEIERYIGACLISSHQNRQQNKAARDRVVFPNREQQQFFPEVYHRNRYCIQRCGSIDTWAGGVPLISFANQRRNRPQVDVVPRNDDQQQLARLAVHTQGAPLILTGRFNHRKNKGFKNTARVPENRAKNENQPADVISVTSDESSGSANSENCLPRIIKPRKRRKKDRKPPHLARPLNQDVSGFSTDSTSPDILDCPSPGVVGLNPYVPFAYDYQSQTSSSTDDGYYNENSEIPRLHHSFEDVEEAEDAPQQTPSVCQCRICDPSGFIWNVDRDCYSPFLTAPRTSLEHKVDDLSSRLSSVALNDDPAEKNGRAVGSGDLEVSTEIITSPNGHRDLEIKFFSSSSVEKVGKVDVLVNRCVDYLLSEDGKNET